MAAAPPKEAQNPVCRDRGDPPYFPNPSVIRLTAAATTACDPAARFSMEAAMRILVFALMLLLSSALMSALVPLWVAAGWQ